MKGIVYYTDNRLDPMIMEVVQQQLIRSGLPIVSVSLEPIDFGDNIVANLIRGVVTMVRQILMGLERSKVDVVFFCEHDVLYHQSHFDFDPPADDTYYFNTNVWRWWYLNDHFITYNGLSSLSGLCANREILVDHYRERLKRIEANGWENGRDPFWARAIGHAPGRFENEKSAYWKSERPNIDIRHRQTLTPAKVRLNRFVHIPENWQEGKYGDIKDWDLRKMFNIEEEKYGS
jgi:hypothetical protein